MAPSLCPLVWGTHPCLAHTALHTPKQQIQAGRTLLPIYDRLVASSREQVLLWAYWFELRTPGTPPRPLTTHLGVEAAAGVCRGEWAARAAAACACMRKWHGQDSKRSQTWWLRHRASKATGVYTLGVTVWELVHGRTAWEEQVHCCSAGSDP